MGMIPDLKKTSMNRCSRVMTGMINNPAERSCSS